MSLQEKAEIHCLFYDSVTVSACPKWIHVSTINNCTAQEMPHKLHIHLALAHTLTTFLKLFNSLQLEKALAPHPSTLLHWESHGQRSLAGFCPWGRWEVDTTKRLHFHVLLLCIGEGNGNPLQCSCLENPRDGGAWWAALYGVAQSWTWLKWLSSSSSIRAPMRHNFREKSCSNIFFMIGMPLLYKQR